MIPSKNGAQMYKKESRAGGGVHQLNEAETTVGNYTFTQLTCDSFENGCNKEQRLERKRDEEQ